MADVGSSWPVWHFKHSVCLPTACNPGSFAGWWQVAQGGGDVGPAKPCGEIGAPEPCAEVGTPEPCGL